ncbi:MAG: anthranilate phosphoribosyltransferase [Tepidisphaeraceae bacterium]
MRDLLLKLTRRENLTRDEARAAFERIMSGEADPAQMAALLMGLNCKGTPTVDEIVGAASVMRERSIRVPTPDGELVLDTCGTGGDVKHTFNISTAAALVVASCGVKVVKHGNRSASSQSGSADVLEALGVTIDGATPHGLHRVLCDANLCFAFARSHHPAMKHVAPVRQALGIPTLFNMIGPLTNPGRAKHQLLGVFKPELTTLFANVLKELGSVHAWIVHGEDGLDELSTMAPSRIVELRDGKLTERTLDASKELGIPRAKLEDLQVTDAASSAAAIRGIFAGETGPRTDIVALNAGAALVIAGKTCDLAAGVATARQAMTSGQAAKTLEHLRQASTTHS